MRTTACVTLMLVAIAAGCGSKTDPAAGAGSAEVKPAAPPPSCPAGSAVKDGACIVVVTPEKIAAVAKQQSRLDDLAKLLDQVDTVGAPIELFDGIRQLDQWKTLKATSAKIAALDDVAAALNNAVKTLRTFKTSLGEASGRIGNLKGTLDQLMTDTGAARKLDDLRSQVSTQVRAVVEPLAAQVEDTIRNALLPLMTQLSELSDLVITGCTMAKLSGGGDKMKALCVQAKDGFTKALAYLDDLKTKPAQLFADVTTQLESQLDQLVDAQTRTLVAAAQTKINEALKLPPAAAAAGSGSGAAGSAAPGPGSGSGSAQ